MRAYDQARAIRRAGARDQGEEAGDALRALAEHLDAARRLVDLPLGGDSADGRGRGAAAACSAGHDGAVMAYRNRWAPDQDPLSKAIDALGDHLERVISRPDEVRKAFDLPRSILLLRRCVDASVSGRTRTDTVQRPPCSRR